MIVNIHNNDVLKGKNQQKISSFINKHKGLLTANLEDSLSGELIERLALETGFVKRKSKLNGNRFLELLMFNCQEDKLQSLDCLTDDLEVEHGESISKQGLDARFNPQAVLFLKNILSNMLSKQLGNNLDCNGKSVFTSCRLRDSSKFGLPEEYSNVYKGYGRATRASLISIQYEFDLLSGNQIDLQLTSGCRNDQQDSKESVDNINKGDLLIRDLGYVTSTYLKTVIKEDAYFLNRLPSQISVFDREDADKEVDFGKVYKKMKKYNLPYIEQDVLVGKKAQIPCRLVIYLNDIKTYKSRMKRTQKNTKSIGCKVSKKQKERALLDTFITNANPESIKPGSVKNIYSLRWQIELVFKVWKSLCKIDKVKKVKICRFECMLLARMIWILANWKVFQLLNKWFVEYIKDKTISIWKFFKYATRNYDKLRKAIFQKHDISEWLFLLINISERKLFRETKKGDVSHFHKISLIQNP